MCLVAEDRQHPVPGKVINHLDDLGYGDVRVADCPVDGFHCGGDKDVHGIIHLGGAGKMVGEGGGNGNRQLPLKVSVKVERGLVD